MTSSVPGHFVNLARRFGVDEADLLMLEHAKIHCAQDLYFKYPNEAAREKLISEVIMPYFGEKDPDTQELQLRDRNLSEEETAGTSPFLSLRCSVCKSRILALLEVCKRGEAKHSPTSQCRLS